MRKNCVLRGQRALTPGLLPIATAALLAATLFSMAPRMAQADSPRYGQATSARPKTAPKSAGTKLNSSPGLLRGGDVMATVEGQPITRRELTYFWLQADSRAGGLLGGLLAERWVSARGQAPAYAVPEAAIYAKLYADPNAGYAAILSNRVTNLLVARACRRQAIVVTETEVKNRAHALLSQVRQQQNTQVSDEELMKLYRVPPEIFYDDVRLRLRGERLLAADVARVNGHPLGDADWAVARALFASVTPSENAAESQDRFAAARARLDDWRKEVAGGKPFAQAASEHNEDATKALGGLRGALVRGTSAKGLESAIFALKPGEVSVPIQAPNGWYAFTVERRGAQISAEERETAWRLLAEARLPAFLAALRKQAKITSVIPLPLDAPGLPAAK